jgi:hypothetical protein
VLKFTDSFSGKPWFEKIVDLATALEAALSGKDKTVTLRICTRAAHILSTDADPAPAIYADVKALYDMRSSLVHGSVITQKELDKWLAAVSSVSRAAHPARVLSSPSVACGISFAARSCCGCFSTATADGRCEATRHRSANCLRTPVSRRSGAPLGTKAPQASVLPGPLSLHKRSVTASTTTIRVRSADHWADVRTSREGRAPLSPLPSL